MLSSPLNPPKSFAVAALRGVSSLLLLLIMVLPARSGDDNHPKPPPAPEIQLQLQTPQQEHKPVPQWGVPQETPPQAVPENSSDKPSLENPKPKNPKNKPEFSIHVNVPEVTLEVSVLGKDGIIIPGLEQQNFHIYEDGEPQMITGFAAEQTQAPVTVVLLVEFAADMPVLQMNALYACVNFLQTLKPEDWAALVLFDKRPHIAHDFTRNKAEIRAALNETGIPLSKEINLFDALYDTLDRLEKLEGRKYVILMGTGRDTFSRKILDQVYAEIAAARDTIIYSLDTDPGRRRIQDDNQMRTFATMTGGRIYYPSSPVDYADVFRDMGQTVRNRYRLSYHSSHAKHDGAWHKIKVEVVNWKDEKNDHGAKYEIMAREGYRAAGGVK